MMKNNKLFILGFIVILGSIVLLNVQMLFLKPGCSQNSIQSYFELITNKLYIQATNMLASQTNLYQIQMKSEGVELVKNMQMVLKDESLSNYESFMCGGFSIVIPTEEELLNDLKVFGFPLDEIPVGEKGEENWMDEAKDFDELQGLLGVTTKQAKFKRNEMEGRHRLAVIIAFRTHDSEFNIERCNHLRLFIPYMEKFLGNIPHRIFIFFQNDTFDKWNKGMLFNIAAKVIPEHYDYFVFHDVDELPLNSTSSYQYSPYPIHRGRSVSRLNFENQKVTTTALMAIFQIPRKIYKEINGFSNAYWGWGGEDDDIFFRVFNRKKEKNEPICLLPPNKHMMSFSLPHRRDHSLSGENKERLDENRKYLFAHKNEKTRKEGFNTIKYEIMDEKHSNSFSLYNVKFLLSKQETRKLN